MSKRVYLISTQRDEGFMLNVIDRTPRRFLWPLFDALHFLTRGRLLYADRVQAAMSWMMDADVTVARIPLTWEQVQAIGKADEWDWALAAQSERGTP